MSNNLLNRRFRGHLRLLGSHENFYRELKRQPETYLKEQVAEN